MEIGDWEGKGVGWVDEGSERGVDDGVVYVEGEEEEEEEGGGGGGRRRKRRKGRERMEGYAGDRNMYIKLKRCISSRISEYGKGMIIGSQKPEK